MPNLFFLVFFLAFVWDEWFGLILLLGGLILWDRYFAYLSLSLGSAPIYIVEFCLAIILLRRLIKDRHSTWQAFLAWPRYFRNVWILFMLAGLIAVLHGLSRGELPMRILRDSALCYYSLWMFVTATIRWNKQKFEAGLIFFSILCTLKAFAIYLDAWGVSALWVQNMCGQPAAASMILGFGLLSSLVLWDWSLRPEVWGMTGLSTTAILLTRVRSAWTGIVVGWTFMVYQAWHLYPKPLFWKRFLTIHLGLALVSFALIRVVDIHWYEIMMHHRNGWKKPVVQVMPPEPVPILSTSLMADSAPAVSKPHSSTEKLTPLTAFPTSHCPPHEPYQTTKPRMLITETHLIKDEFLSFFQGLNSPNVNTRKMMWQDASSEVLSLGLFSPYLTGKDLASYNLPPVIEMNDDHVVTVPVIGEGIEVQKVSLYLATSPLLHPMAGQRFLRMLFGMGFGKLYLPPQVVWVVNSFNRYDPHNSYIHIFYRMGFFGLLTFLSLIVLGFQHLGRLLRLHSPRSDLYRFLVALGACLLLHLIHSFTDNTLENAFKGIWFWIFWGWIITLGRISTASDAKTFNRP